MKTTISVREKTRNKLSRYKYRLKAADYDEVLTKIFNIIEKLKLWQELEDDSSNN